MKALGRQNQLEQIRLVELMRALQQELADDHFITQYVVQTSKTPRVCQQNRTELFQQPLVMLLGPSCCIIELKSTNPGLCIIDFCVMFDLLYILWKHMCKLFFLCCFPHLFSCQKNAVSCRVKCSISLGFQWGREGEDFLEKRCTRETEKYS